MPIRGILHRSLDMWREYSTRFLGYDRLIVPVTWRFLK